MPLLDAAGSLDVVEIDPEVYWQACIMAIRKVLNTPSERSSDGGGISTLCISSQGETLICLDARGQPTRKAIVWLDNRAAREAVEALAGRMVQLPVESIAFQLAALASGVLSQNLGLGRGQHAVEAPQDGRAVFVMPWHGHTLLGTTERPYHDDSDKIEPTQEEIDCLLTVYRHSFPERSQQLLSAWAGLRVLPPSQRSA